MKSRCTALVMSLTIAMASSPLTAQSYPNQPIELVAAGDPGGGLDLHARWIETAFTQEKIGDKPFTIVNKGAGGGNASTAYMVTQRANPYTIVVNTNRVLLNSLTGTSPYSLKDLTPIARLTAEFEIWVVKADSKYKTALEVIEDLKKNPKAVAFGIGTAPPATDQLSALMPAKAKGVDVAKMNIVAFRGAGDLATQLLGGHIGIGSTSISELMSQLEAGKLRALAVSAPSRLDKLKGVPTWKELGIDVVLSHWRGIFGPPDMPKDALNYWSKKFEQMSKTKAWNDILTKNLLENVFLPADQFKKELETDNAAFKELLATLGMLAK